MGLIVKPKPIGIKPAGIYKRQDSTITWTMTRKETEYIGDLLVLGLYGESMAEVACTLVRRGLQQAMHDGFLVRR